MNFSKEKMKCCQIRQKQSFVDVFQNRCSYKFRNIHRKTPMLESLFNEVAGLRLLNRILRGASFVFIYIRTLVSYREYDRNLLT